jgi:hypothetical protein
MTEISNDDEEECERPYDRHGNYWDYARSRGNPSKKYGCECVYCYRLQVELTLNSWDEAPKVRTRIL